MHSNLVVATSSKVVAGKKIQLQKSQSLPRKIAKPPGHLQPEWEAQYSNPLNPQLSLPLVSSNLPIRLEKLRRNQFLQEIKKHGLKVLCSFQDENETTLLHIAACMGYSEAVKYLLNLGMSPNKKNKKGKSSIS